MPTIKSVIITFSIVLVGLFHLALWLEGWTAVFLAMTGVAVGVVLAGTLVVALVSMVWNRNLEYVPAFLLAAICVSLVVFNPFEFIVEKLKSPSVYYGYCEHTVTRLTLKLRQDSTFEYNAGAFLTSEIYCGKYSIHTDTIKLHFNDSAPNNVQNELLITDEAIIEFGDSLGHKHHFMTTFNDLKK